MQYADYIIGKGQVGSAIGAVLKDSSRFIQFVDPDKGLKVEDLVHPSDDMVRVVHICFPFTNWTFFNDSVRGYATAIPHDALIIHSTVMPGTCNELSDLKPIYSPVRGQHDNLEQDLRSYVKYMACEDFDRLVYACNRFAEANIIVRSMGNDVKTLEWTKHISNTLYYHWMIGYRQMVHQWCEELWLDEEALWSFTQELHAKTGIQYPSYFDPKGVGGHCVLQNTQMLTRMSNKPDSMCAILDLLMFVNDQVLEEKCHGAD